MAGGTSIPVAGARAHTAHRGLTTTLAGLAGLAALAVGAALPTAPAAAKSTTTTTAKPLTNAQQADRWLIEAIGHEARIGSVHVDGKVSQGKSTFYIDLEVNGDGEGGGTFIQDGFQFQIERVGPVLYFNAPKAYWAKHASAAQAAQYGGRWLEFPAEDARFISFDQFLSADDLVNATFQGHKSALSVGRATTYQGHKVVIVKDTETAGGKTATGSMYIAATGPEVVYRIVAAQPGNQSTIVFTHYGKAVGLTVPPDAINLAS